jgi:heme-degrading monooxygenase HmoA
MVRLIKRRNAMPIVRANTGIVTQINVFTVPEGEQQPLIDILSEAARFASDTPGWISASLHRSQDGTRVANYAQSESLEAAQAVIRRLRDGGWFARNKAAGEAHPGLYDAVFTLER